MKGFLDAHCASRSISVVDIGARNLETISTVHANTILISGSFVDLDPVVIFDASGLRRDNVPHFIRFQ